MPVIKILAHPDYCPAGAEITAPAGTSICEALLHNPIRIHHPSQMNFTSPPRPTFRQGPPRHPDRDGASRRDELRLPPLPCDRAPGARLAQSGRRRGRRPARPRLGPGTPIAPVLPSDRRAAGPGAGDSPLQHQPRKGKPLMPRQIVLDTETTGLSADSGDRIIEFGCVELLNRKLTGNNLHLYFNPGRDSHEDALKAHGISNEFLKDKPRFAELGDDILQYLQGAELIIHNAHFVFVFFNQELELPGHPALAHCVERVTDTLAMAKELYPGKRNSLDALCDRLGVDNSG